MKVLCLPESHTGQTEYPTIWSDHFRRNNKPAVILHREHKIGHKIIKWHGQHVINTKHLFNFRAKC